MINITPVVAFILGIPCGFIIFLIISAYSFEKEDHEIKSKNKNKKKFGKISNIYYKTVYESKLGCKTLGNYGEIISLIVDGLNKKKENQDKFWNTRIDPDIRYKITVSVNADFVEILEDKDKPLFSFKSCEDICLRHP